MSVAEDALSVWPAAAGAVVEFVGAGGRVLERQRLLTGRATYRRTGSAAGSGTCGRGSRSRTGSGRGRRPMRRWSEAGGTGLRRSRPRPDERRRSTRGPRGARATKRGWPEQLARETDRLAGSARLETGRSRPASALQADTERDGGAVRGVGSPARQIRSWAPRARRGSRRP
ncbi:uncharacterized protein SOCEGT47_060290 [Sorangium cellulosum]|uniref:Uncharacterized protein n=1 Tax=Sorangium cellulosum TaxID=56 RepID=A0A4V0NEA4_SORCE|nr:uncharacterized protein SOCEGT47_060290 [Sorangium cellulosum]